LDHDPRVRPLILLLALAVVGWAEEENSAQRMEKAQKGMAGGSWPRKPDSRLSPLSGKMKDVSEISPRFYGQEKEFKTKSWGDSQKEVNQAATSDWGASSSRRWEEARWNQTGEWSGRENKNAKFQPSAESGSPRLLSHRELSPASAPDWSSRSSSLAGQSDRGLRMYEGRLTRVRDQVWREEINARDLGPGRQEKFSPEEVEKMLSEPAGGIRGAATGQSGGASLPSVAGN